MAKKKNVKVAKTKQNVISTVLIALVLFVLSLSIILLKDKMGVVGEFLSKGFFIIFGLAAYVLPLYLLFMFFVVRNEDVYLDNKKNIIMFSILLINIGVFAATFFHNGEGINEIIENSYNQALNYTGVGIIFSLLYFLFHTLIADIGIYIVTVLLFFISYFYILDISISEFFNNLFSKIKLLFSKKDQTEYNSEYNEERPKVKKKKKEIQLPEVESENQTTEYIEPQISYHNSNAVNYEKNDSKNENNEFEQSVLNLDYEYIKPSLDLLNNSKKTATDDKEILLNNAELITDTLSSFGIESEVVNINNGPTVTSYEVKPQSGIKVSKIVNLSNNLAMALSSPSIRIEAPIPGKPYVGIEVPNQNKDVVTFKSLLSTEEFQREDDDITVVIGKDIFGKPLYAKINEMPHLLIAGATGSGKSVLMNAIIMSIIYKYSPQDVEFIMIDPKMVELKIYSGIPHLKGRKVVTKAQEATASLHEAVREMTDRFELFAEAGARDIKAYNEKVKDDNEDGNLEKLPYLVVIIDELSDLMMEASKDVENYITRLAQMGRASGVHLIIATQRPSVNVITGIIKANIPSRIAFAVASNVDSRTILDSSGAEKLLGKGDMLYYPSKYPKPKRAQGAFVTDHEVERVVTFVKNKNEVEMTNESFNEKIEQANKPQENLEEVDELFDEAVRFVLMENTASISAIQRRFRVGYARAGRIVDQMTLRGIVSEQDGSKPRNILMTLEEYDNIDGELNE